MEARRLDYLLEQYHAGTCTQAESEELNAWFHDLDHGQADIEARLQAAGGRDELAAELLADFQARAHQQPGKTRSLAIYFKVAAAVLVFAAIGAWFYMTRTGEAPKQPIAVQQPATIEPGNNKAVLTLASGATLTLTDAANGQLANESGVTINKTADGQIVYTASTQEGDAATALSYNMIDIPRGGQYQLILPDGSKVWLNAATKLRYPVRFTGAERRVELSGEAYFEVAHNKEQPFIVISDKQEIKVLGTHFNVKAYGDEEMIKTTLLEGSVQVNVKGVRDEIVLKPGQQANLSADQMTLRVVKANTDEAVAWKSGYFLFDNQDVRSIMKMISRWYDVDVVYEGMNKVEHFGGSFSRSSNLSDLLANLEAIGNTHFTIKERRIIVSN